MGKTIGYVPTMGFLHEGHLSLIKKAREENDVVVVSIFVNPTQFGPSEDLDSYPRDLERDKSLCENQKVDIIFAPENSEMYGEGFSTYVETFGNITKKLCGASREGHFRGVTSVLTKFFNILGPDRAYFGQKDAQQVAVVKKMVKEMNFPLEIISCPIVREKDGLALSSRNTYLTETERKDALILSKSLYEAKNLIENGEKSAKKIKNFIIDRINTVSYAKIDYVELVDSLTLDDIEEISGNVLIALAVKFGKPRLIDNVTVEVN
jgi:pantoate--beta-alanine ligase